MGKGVYLFRFALLERPVGHQLVGKVTAYQGYDV